MSITHAIIFGIVQGLTEFLPISSSAHLVLLPYFLKWPDPGLAYNVALHWGTLIAVLIYFRRDVIQLIIGGLGFLTGKREFENKLPWFIVAATIPGAFLGYLFEEKAETIFRNPLLIAGTLSGLGILLYLVDRFMRNGKSLDQLNLKNALLIGVSQGLAIVPGVSRSGITITTGLFSGLSREAAVRFSFLLSIPIIAGAGVLKIKDLASNLHAPDVLVGVLTSAVSGYVAIHFLMNFVKTRSFKPFVFYRFALSAAILVIWFVSH